MAEPIQQAFAYPRLRGECFVRYKDGNISGLMPKDVANSYASIFGGTVHIRRSASLWKRICFGGRRPL